MEHLSQTHSANSYKLTIDRFGRVVVPLPLREAYRLKPGVGLKVTSLTEQGFSFEVDRKPASLRKTARWCFAETSSSKKVKELEDSVLQDREERDQKIRGEFL